MNKKQIIGLVAATVSFVFIGSMSVLFTVFTNKIIDKSTDNVEKIATGFEESESIPNSDFVGVVEVKGTIIEKEESQNIFSTSEGYNHKKTLGYIDKMINSDSNKGILLYVDSPGGGVYESDELYLKLKEYKKKTGRPVWAYMGKQACSGGYYISMAADKIIANRNTWTGSIGVIMSMNNLKGLYDKLGIEQVNIVSGANKDMGSPGKALTDEQKQILQSLVDESYGRFLNIVSEGRDIDVNQLKPIADGRIYTAEQAEKLKLIDEIGTYEGAQQQMEDYLGDDLTFYKPKNKANAFSSLFSELNLIKPKSDAQILTEYLEKNNDGGLMYYAK